MKSDLDWVAHGIAVVAECLARAGVPYAHFCDDLQDLERKAVLHIAERARRQERDLFAAPVYVLAETRHVHRNTIRNLRQRAKRAQQNARELVQT